MVIKKKILGIGHSFRVWTRQWFLLQGNMDFSKKILNSLMSKCILEIRLFPNWIEWSWISGIWISGIWVPDRALTLIRIHNFHFWSGFPPSQRTKNMESSLEIILIFSIESLAAYPGEFSGENMRRKSKKNRVKINTHGNQNAVFI